MGLVAFRLVLALLVCLASLDLAPSRSARAQATEHEARGARSAKRWFQRGLAHAERGDWERAARAFEASLALDDRPAARFNAVLAHAELAQPLEVVRHALAFLQGPESAARATARATVVQKLEAAATQLAVLRLDHLPDDAEPLLDGAPPSLRDASRAFAAPGPHQLQLRRGQARGAATTLVLAPGSTTAWPQPLPPQEPGPALQVEAVDLRAAATPDEQAPAVSEPDVARLPPAVATDARSMPPRPTRRVRLAWALGAMGLAAELAGTAMYGVARRRASDLAERDPTVSGFLGASDRYERARRSVLPLALSGGLLMSGAAASAPAFCSTPARTWSTVAVAVGLSVTSGWLLARTAPRVGATRLRTPTAEAGTLLLGVTLPINVLAGRSVVAGACR